MKKKKDRIYLLGDQKKWYQTSGTFLWCVFNKRPVFVKSKVEIKKTSCPSIKFFRREGRMRQRILGSVEFSYLNITTSKTWKVGWTIQPKQKIIGSGLIIFKSTRGRKGRERERQTGREEGKKEGGRGSGRTGGVRGEQGKSSGTLL